MVSVIIPAYNAARCIGRAIESVLGQSYSAYEIIVIDDGSKDNTAEVVRQYGDQVHYIHQENAGVAVARNTGIAAAKGDWIAFLDADDEWLPDKLRQQIALLARNPNLRWCGANRFQSDGKRKAAVGDKNTIAGVLGERDYFANYITAAANGKCHVITSSMIIRKDIFDELGGFDPDRPLMDEDLDMWLGIAQHYPEMGYIAEPLSINHLDVVNLELAKIRWERKKGGNLRTLVARHLQLAEELGNLDTFRPYAKKLLREPLITAIYNGFKTDARKIVTQFSDLFGWHWRLGTYLLTIFPKITSAAAKTLAYIGYKLGLERQVTRRWIYPNTIEKDNEK